MMRVYEKSRIIAEMGATLSRDLTSLRYLRRWVRTLRPGRGPLSEGLPWMNFKVIEWLDSYLRPSMSAFEYGVGGSTVFVARRVHSLLSVEHDPKWFREVAAALRAEGIANCDLRLVPPDGRCPPANADDYGPYVSTAKGMRGTDFETYVRSIDAQEDRSLDLVIVDGYARLACVAHAVPKVRPGGYILVDDTDWRKYRQSFEVLHGFSRTDFVGVTPFQRNLRQTSVWEIE